MPHEFTEEDKEDLVVFGPNARIIPDDGHRLQIEDGPDGGWILSRTWKPPALRAVEEMDPEYRKELRALLGVAMTRLIRRREVESRTGLGRSRIYELIEEGRFPKPVNLGSKRAVAWVETEVEAWLQARIEERDKE